MVGGLGGCDFIISSPREVKISSRWIRVPTGQVLLLPIHRCGLTVTQSRARLCNLSPSGPDLNPVKSSLTLTSSLPEPLCHLLCQPPLPPLFWNPEKCGQALTPALLPLFSKWPSPQHSLLSPKPAGKHPQGQRMVPQGSCGGTPSRMHSGKGWLRCS